MKKLSRLRGDLMEGAPLTIIIGVLVGGVLCLIFGRHNIFLIIFGVFLLIVAIGNLIYMFNEEAEVRRIRNRRPDVIEEKGKIRERKIGEKIEKKQYIIKQRELKEKLEKIFPIIQNFEKTREKVTLAELSTHSDLSIMELKENLEGFLRGKNYTILLSDNKEEVIFPKETSAINSIELATAQFNKAKSLSRSNRIESLESAGQALNHLMRAKAIFELVNKPTMSKICEEKIEEIRLFTGEIKKYD